MADHKQQGDDKSQKTSGNREESMNESGDDAFGTKSAIGNPERTKDTNDPRSSGTVGLNDEDRDSFSAQKPPGE